jgi:hypothetical protein
LGPPSLLYDGYRLSFLGVKRPSCGIDHPSLSNTEVKGRVELYLYSPSGRQCNATTAKLFLDADRAGLVLRTPSKLQVTMQPTLLSQIIVLRGLEISVLKNAEA